MKKQKIIETDLEDDIVEDSSKLHEEVDSNNMSHSPTESDKFEEYVKPKNRSIIYDPQCDHTQLAFDVGIKFIDNI